MSHLGLVTVFGGTGFIGRPLVQRLLQDGHAVRVVSRRAAPQAASGNPEMVRADLSDPDRIARAIQGSTIVFHNATGGGQTWADFECEVVDATRAIGDACARERVRRLIYTSSIAALYLGSAGRMNESAGCDSHPEKRNLYSRAKIRAEEVLLRQHAELQLPVVILRPGVVLGSGGVLAHAGFGVWPSDLCCVGWAAGTNPLPLVLVDDVVEALVAAMNVPHVEGKSFNLAGDVRLSAREYVALVAQLSRRRFKFFPKAPWQLYAVDLAKWVLKILARKPENPLPSLRDIESCSLRTQLDCTAARRELSWTPNPDKQEFIARAILPHLRPLAAGDLRIA